MKTESFNVRELIERLVLSPSISGFETEAREKISSILTNLGMSVETDVMGNLYGIKRSGERYKLMLAAHMDQIGIMVSRLNASLLIAALKDIAFPSIPKNIEELKEYFLSNKIIVMGGFQPGQSTDAVAALSAETIKADFLIYAKDVDGVYTKDPNKDPSAKKIEQISIKELLKLVINNKVWAGEYELIDLVAVKIIERSKIPTWIVSGLNVENIKKVLLKEHIGTKILTS